ncbi:MAG: endopeptidase La [Thermaerobacter sp.]|nr:endopeptidase La [Thermaerobacter sp.]
MEEQAKAEENRIPEVLPILPLKNTVVYPATFVPLAVGQESSLKLVEASMSNDRIIGVVGQHSQEQRAYPKDVYGVGTACRIHHALRMPGGSIQLMVQGLERIRIVEYLQEEPFLTARVQTLPETVEESVVVEALGRNAAALFERLVALAPYLTEDLIMAAMNMDDTRQLTYFIATNMRMEQEERQKILEGDSLQVKLETITNLLNKEIKVLELGRKIQSEAEAQMGKVQREYFLREELKAIRRELGEEDAEAAEINNLREQLEQVAMAPEAKAEAQRELQRLERIPSASPEHSVIRTYLDWLLNLPWNTLSAEPIDILRAREILDQDHYDLTKPKERILEYLAVRKLQEERAEEFGAPPHGPILCFVGPPGVGKTSLGQSIARAMGRKFVRMSLGGMRDEAEIRGHRRTYVGALPGRIIQGIRRAQTRDPVFMLDEVDKIGMDWRGDPSSALLEVLDPEQNRDFRDHYLDVPFDLSQVLFITTANTLETVPPALRDRMEVLELPGYTEEEKVQIARQYLLPRQLGANGLRPGEAEFSDEAFHLIIAEYTREAGVRNLERETATICRRLARQKAEGQEIEVQVTPDRVRSLLGKPRFFAEVAERVDRPGVATGLVWTPAGGDIIFVEAALMPGSKSLKLTGQMGDVMRESAEAALSYVRSRAEELRIDPNFYEKHDVHIHVPAGAVPKDGPSAGVTIAVALASILTGRPVRHDVAMTGEVTLRGKVLPVGGVRDKVLGALRAGIDTVILPRPNEVDLEELTPEAREKLHFTPVENVDEALEAALVPEPGRRAGRD